MLKMEFSRDDTKVVKGVAVLLMILLHCFAFPDRIGKYSQIITTGIMIHGETLLYAISQFGIICLSIFTFLTGIGMYKQYSNKGEYSISKKIISFYKEYWKVFLIFIPIGFLFFGRQGEFCDQKSVYEIFNNFSLEKLIKDFLGLESNYNREWWFIRTYFFSMILGFIYIKLMAKCKTFWAEFLVIVMISIFINRIVPNMGSVPITKGIDGDFFFKNIFRIHNCAILTLMGIVVDKYNIISKIYLLIFEKKNKLLKVVISIILIFGMIYFRNYIGFTGVDLLIVPLFVVCIINIASACKWLYIVLRYVGEHSMTMWLVHSFYCYYFGIVQNVIYSTRVPALIFFIVVVMSLITSILLKKFWELPGKIKYKIQSKNSRNGSVDLNG